MRWSNIVAIGGKDHKRAAQVAQVDLNIIAKIERALFELVADEEMIDDFNHLFATEAVPGIPPALEFEEPFFFPIEVEKEVGIFVPDGGLGFQRLEVLDEPSAIEPTVTEIADKIRQPAPAKETAGKPHGVGPGLPRPI